MASKDLKSGGDASGKDSALKPIDKNTLINYYAPIIGTASYSLLSVNVLNPTLNLG